MYCFLNWLWNLETRFQDCKSSQKNRKTRKKKIASHQSFRVFFFFKNLIMSEYLHKSVWSVADWQAREARRASRPLLGLIELSLIYSLSCESHEMPWQQTSKLVVIYLGDWLKVKIWIIIKTKTKVVFFITITFACIINSSLNCFCGGLLPLQTEGQIKLTQPCLNRK